MPPKPSKKLMIALRDFVFRHEIFVEAREFEDGFIFARRPRARSKRFGLRRHFRVSLRRGRRRVHFYSLTCGSDDVERFQVPIDFPEKALLRPAEAAIEFESCGRKLARYIARYPEDIGASRALFGYVRSESRLIERLLGDGPYRELLGLVRRHLRQRRPGRRGLRP